MDNFVTIKVYDTHIPNTEPYDNDPFYTWFLSESR